MVNFSDLCKVILLGDINQLPSIQPGNVLRDLFQSMHVNKYVIELRTNHRSEGGLIFDNAQRISEGRLPMLDSCVH